MMEINIRELAREIAEKHTGRNPDTQIIPVDPERLYPGGYLLAPSETVPLWHQYVEAARHTIFYLRRIGAIKPEAMMGMM